MAYTLNDEDVTPDQGADTRIRRKTRMSLEYYAQHPEQIGRRLDELDAEPSVEKVLQLGTAGASLAGFLFAVTRSRVWLLLPVAAAGMSLQHAVKGQSKSHDWVRKLGFRSTDEIERERYALKSLRGDVSDYDLDMDAPERVQLPENTGRSSDALPSRSSTYVE